MHLFFQELQRHLVSRLVGVGVFKNDDDDETNRK